MTEYMSDHALECVMSLTKMMILEQIVKRLQSIMKVPFSLRGNFSGCVFFGGGRGGGMEDVNRE